MNQEPKSNIGKIIGCGCAAIILAGIVFSVAIFFGVTKLVKSSEGYQQAVAAATSHPEVIEAIGEPIKEGLVPKGKVSTNNGSGEVDVRITLTGPKGSGVLYAVGTRPAGSGVWTYSTLAFSPEGGSGSITITP